MAARTPEGGDQAQSAGGVPARPLDDVMIAMDVVDTLRQDQRIAERELNDEARRAELIERLRALYKSQGIEVPDAILEEGVKALEEHRFAYDPPAYTWQVRLARLYVSRGRWGRMAAAGAGALALAWGGWYLLAERPRLQAAAAIEAELKSAIPTRLDRLTADLAAVAKRPEIAAEAKSIAAAARAAAGRGDADAARAGVTRLATLLADLEQTFEVRIVSRKGEITGLWRVPKVNPLARNYYLVVEAIDPAGRLVEREVVNEETGKRERVKRWAQRVTKSVFDEIEADKRDDGILQKALLGKKVRGETEIQWLREVEAGALTRW